MRSAGGVAGAMHSLRPQNVSGFKGWKHLMGFASLFPSYELLPAQIPRDRRYASVSPSMRVMSSSLKPK
jgi:hypothetical protein